MIKEDKKIDKVVYIVDSHIVINDRVSKIFELRGYFKKMILVKAGRQKTEDQIIGISPIINPIAVLQRFKLEWLNNLLDKYIFFPSSKIFYVKAVNRKLKMLISKDLSHNENVCVLVCLPVHDLVLAGLTLKQKYPQIKFLIDWQDLWSYDENYLSRMPKYYRKRMLKLESSAFNNSDINITTNEFAKKIVEQHYKVDPERVISINHHFDPKDLHAIPQKQQNQNNFTHRKKITIGFLGSLFKPPRVPGEKILEAIQYNRNKGVDLELHLYGDSPKTLKNNLQPAVVEGVFAHGRYDHKESIKKISQCDLLLLVLSDLPNCKVVMSIKLPHYLLIKKPILAIVPEKSAVAEIINTTGSGYVIPSSSYHWGKELKKVLDGIITGSLTLRRREDNVEKYSWNNISRQWLHVLKTV